METTAIPGQPKVCFEVEEIIGVSVGVGNVKNYCVRWAPTWISGMNLVGCEMLINEFLCGQHQQSKLIPSQLEELDVDADIRCTGSVKTLVEQPQCSHTNQQHHQEQQLLRQKNTLQEVEQQHQQQYRQKILLQEEKLCNKHEKRYQRGQLYSEPAEQLNHQGEQQHQQLGKGQQIQWPEKQQQQQQQQNQQIDQQLTQHQLTLPEQKEPHDIHQPEEQSEVDQPDQCQSEQQTLNEEQIQEQESIHFQRIGQLQLQQQQQITQVQPYTCEDESPCILIADETHTKENNKLYQIQKSSVQVLDEIVPLKESVDHCSDEFEDQGYKHQKEQLYFQQQQTQPQPQSWQQSQQPQKLPPVQQQQQLQHHLQQSDMTDTIPCSANPKYEVQKQIQYVRMKDTVEGELSKEDTAGTSSYNDNVVKIEEEEEDDSYVEHKSINISDLSVNSSSWLGGKDSSVNSKRFSLKPLPLYRYRIGSYHARIMNENELAGSFLHSDAIGESNHVDDLEISPTAVDLFKCNTCNISFSRGCDLNHHIRMIHSVASEKKFSCNICHKKFSHHSSVVNHQKLHSGIKPFTCAVCHAAFSRKDYLTKHFQRHSEERPYVCIVCNKSFKRTDSLKQHVNKLHKNLTNLNNDRFNQQQ